VSGLAEKLRALAARCKDRDIEGSLYLSATDAEANYCCYETVDALRARAEEAEAERDEAVRALKQAVAPTDVGGGPLAVLHACVAERDERIAELEARLEKARGLERYAMTYTSALGDHMAEEYGGDWMRADDVLDALSPTEEDTDGNG